MPAANHSVMVTYVDVSPAVVSSVRLNANPSALGTVNFIVTFSEAVTGVDAADFSLNPTVTGAVITSVSGVGMTRTVAVSAGTGSGTLKLNVLDNDSIKDSSLNSLNGVGVGTVYSGGEEYDLLVPLGVGKYDDVDLASRWRYTGAWFTYSGTGPYSSTMHYTYALGNSAQIAISGQQFKLSYTASANYGLLDIYIDDVKVATLNQNSAPSGYQKTWTSGLLLAGTHIVRLVKAGSTS